MADTFTLVEFFTQVQRGADGRPYWEEPSCDIEGKLMVFSTPEDARGMAAFIMGADSGTLEREPRPDHADIIGVLCHNYDAEIHNSADEGDDDDRETWSYGWVDVDGVLHEGDYESAPYWHTNPVLPS